MQVGKKRNYKTMKNTFLILPLLLCCIVSAAQSPISNNGLLSSKFQKSASVDQPVGASAAPTSVLPAASSLGSVGTGYGSASSGYIFGRAGHLSGTVYTPFSNETPTTIRPRRSGSGDDDDDDDWGYGGGGTGGNSGDPEVNKFSPVGSEWCLLLFALSLMLIIRKRLKEYRQTD